MNSHPSSPRSDIVVHIAARPLVAICLLQLSTATLPALDLQDALDASNLTWSSPGSASWTGQNLVSHDGQDAAQSGRITNSQESWLETTVLGPGTLSFWWKVSSEDGYDFLEFYISGIRLTNVSGEVDWRQEAISIPSGYQTLRWRYVKDDNLTAGKDRGWVDQVIYTTVRNRPDQLAEAVDATNLTWSTGGSNDWMAWDARYSPTHDGADAAQSGDISDSSECWLQTTVTGPGAVVFWWKVSSETNYDFLECYLGDTRQTNISGEVDWRLETLPIPAGSQTVRWQYTKDQSLSAGQDSAWLDQVLFLSSSSPPVILMQPASKGVVAGTNVTFTVTAVSALPCTYHWLKDGQPVSDDARVSGAGSASLTLSNATFAEAGVYSVVLGNAFGSVTSAPALLFVGRTAHGFARGEANAVHVVGSYAYVAVANFELGVFDLSIPTNPLPVGSFRSSGIVQGVQVVGQYAYLAAHSAGLEIIDVSNPTNCVRVGGYDTSAPAFDVCVVGRYAYVAEFSAGFEVIDVSNPTNCVRVGGYAAGGVAYAVQVVGQYAYVADYHWGLQVIDVSNPTNCVRVGGYDTSGVAYGVQVVGQFAYVADGSSELQVINVSNPTNCVRVGGYAAGGVAYAVQVVGQFAYLAGSGLQVIDVSNPTNCVRAGGATGGTAIGVNVVGEYAYVAAGNAGLQVINVSDPTNCVRVGGYDTGSGTTPGGMYVLGPYAYVAAGTGGLRVFDVSDPANAQTLRGYPTSGYANDVQVVGHFAYLADALGLQIIDVSDPVNFVRVGGWIGSAYGVQVVGQYAYVADGNSGLHIIDVGNPTNSVRVGGCGLGGYASGVNVVGHNAYVAAGAAGLHVINVSNPANCMPVGRYDLIDDDRAYDVQVLGLYAYVADWYSGLQVIDVSKPTAPIRVGGCETRSHAYGLHVVGHYAFVAAGGLQVIDVSNPTNCVYLGSYDTGGDARCVQVVGQYAYVADGYSGLTIVRLPFPGIQPLTIAGVKFGDGVFHFSFDTQNGTQYVIESKSALEGQTWSEFTRRAGTGGPLWVTNGPAADPSRFYRIRTE